LKSDERRKALEDRREEIAGRSERIWTKTDFENFPVYKVPTDLLVLNAGNRRFRAEAQEVEKELGRRLDPEVDEESIIALLLDTDPHVEGEKVVGGHNKDTDALISDWKRRHQERALWVRPNGLVSNGNRRLAMLKRLQAIEGTTGYDWVDVVFMDEQTYDEETLFEMEAREQLTEGFKVRYNKINLLLTLKDAAEKHGVDWHDPNSIKVVAEKIQHLVSNNPSYARVQLQAVKAMSDYLDWIDRPNEYYSLSGMVERFRDVGKNMEWLASNAPEHEAAMLELCFRAIQSGNNHPDIREMRRLVKRDPASFEGLVDEVEKIAYEPEVDDEPESEPSPAAADVDEDDEDRDADADDEVVTADRPTTARQKRIKEAVNAAAQASRAHDDPPETKLRTAALKLGEVDVAEVLGNVSGGDRDRLVVAITQVVAWAEIAKEHLGNAEKTEA
jgi:hypothetical protein